MKNWVADGDPFLLVRFRRSTSKTWVDADARVWYNKGTEVREGKTMRRVYFEDGTIMECERQCVLRRNIKVKLSCDGPMRYWFRPTDAYYKAMKRYQLIY